MTPLCLAWPLLNGHSYQSLFSGGNIMNNFGLLILCLSLIISGNVLAKEEVIATITNDENPEIYKFVAQVDDMTDEITNFYKDDYLNGQKSEREMLSMKELSEDGLILEKRGSHNVINLKSDDFDQHQGGVILIDTLLNGINGQRKQYELQLTKSKEGWKLLRVGNIISTLHIVVNKKAFLGSVGIKDIKMK
jgi:hypothetical protein